MIPVSRKEWQQIAEEIPAFIARRWIMRKTSMRDMPLAVTSLLRPRVLRQRGLDPRKFPGAGGEKCRGFQHGAVFDVMATEEASPNNKTQRTP